MNKRFITYLSSLVIVLAAITSLHAFSRPASAVSIDNTPDCDNVAIIHCGAMTEPELQKAFAANAYGDLPTVYAAFGLNASSLSGFVDGIVWKDGRVTVGDKTVATGAITAGRNYGGTPIAGTKNAAKFSTNKFVTDGQTALVKIVNGQFKYAVIKSCGNPVTATPTPPPTPPKPAPVASCTAIKAIKIDTDSYSFDAAASTANGATVSSYTFRVMKGASNVQSKTVTTTALKANSGAFTLQPGTYNVSVTVKTSVGDKTGAACATTVTVPTPPKKVEVCNPTTGETIVVDESEASKYKPVGDAACGTMQVCELSTKQIVTIKTSEYDETKYSKDLSKCEETPPALPSTGPAEFIGGGLGIGSLTAAGYYWRASRRNLISAFLKR